MQRTSMGVGALIRALVAMAALAVPWRAAVAQVSVTPYGGSASAASNSTSSVDFTVQNNTGGIETFDISCSIGGQVSSCSPSTSQVQLRDGTSATVTVTYNTGNPGAGSVYLDAAGEITGFSDEGWYNVTVTGSSTLAATVTLAQNGVFRDIGRCVQDCFENTLSYATPAYTTMDVQRSVALHYRSWQAHPLATIQLDATDSSQTPADSLSLKLQRQNGSLVTFTNGSQEIFFRGGVSNGTTRLAAQFDASAVGTTDSTYTAIVTSYWHGGTPLHTNYPVRILVINESSSPYGAGWSIAGLQRVYVGTDGGVVVVDGTGSASFFSGGCVPSSSCTFSAPSGEFSVLSTVGNGYKRHYPDGTDYNFTSVGLLSTVVDRFGNTTYYFYDANNRVSSIQDPTGAAAVFGYDAGTGKLDSITTLGGRLSKFSIDGSGDLRSVIDPDSVYAFHADYATGPHRLTHLVDRRGGSWDYAYSVDGTLDSIQAPTITANGNATRPTTTLSGPSTRILAAISGGAGSASSPVARGIDVRGTVRNPRGYATNFTLNAWGSPTLIQDPLGRNTTLTYDATTSQPKSITAVSGRLTSYSWDGPRLIQVVDGPKTVHMQYETVFNQLTHIYGDVAEQWYTYDTTKIGRPLLTSRVAGQGPTTYAFDLNGRLFTATDAMGHVTTWYRETVGNYTLGNTDSISAPGLLAIRFTYDSRGRVIATRYPDGSVDSTYYDTMNRVIAQVDGSQHRTSYSYDSLYLRSVTDPKSQQYIYSSNALGWLEQETRPGSAVPLITAYDVNGNVISTTNRRGGQVTYSFDALDRDTIVTADGQATHITYGANDGSVQFVNSESSDNLVADSYGRFTQDYISRSGNTYTINAVLANDDRILGYNSTSSHWSGTKGPSFTYDSTNNVKTISSSIFTGSATITWNRDGLPTQVLFPNGLTSTSDFTSAHAVSSVQYSTGIAPTVLLQRDSLGRIGTRTPGTFADSVSSYRYNPDGTLAWWGLSVRANLPCTFNSSYGWGCPHTEWLRETDYSYDPVGNQTTGGASYNANRLLSASGYTMTYDEDGNLISKSGAGFSQTLRWNSLGQLDSVTTNGTTVTFGYDGLGRRVRKTVSGATTGYLYAGDDLFMELDASGNPVTEYAYWPSVDAPLAMSKGGQAYYLTQDPVGSSITGLVRASDNSLQASYKYSPFGTLLSGSFDNVGNSLQFGARQYDSETGLTYFRARYYDPQVGRFISEDPIGLGGGINPYVFAGNDPINGGDPSGLDPNDNCPDGYHEEWAIQGGEIISDNCYPDVPNGENPNPSPRGSGQTGGPPPGNAGGNSPAPAPQKPNRCSDQTSEGQVSLGAGFQVQVPFLGASFGGNINLVITSSGRIVLQGQGNFGVGVGAYLGGGANWSVGRSDVIPTGFSTSANTTILQANAGMGESAGAALTIDDDIELPDRGLGGGVALKLPGVGYGVQASAGRLASANLASHPYALVRKLMLNNCTP